jgi:hypothetical protein
MFLSVLHVSLGNSHCIPLFTLVMLNGDGVKLLCRSCASLSLKFEVLEK